MSKSDSIFSIGLLALAAYVLYSMGLLEKPNTATTTKDGRYCPKGERYPATTWDMLFGCREGYERAYFGDDCVCTAPKPSSTSGTEHSPQTPPPKPDLCPWNSSLLAGDVRCQNPSQNTVIIGKPEPGFTECIIGAPKWDGGC